MRSFDMLLVCLASAATARRMQQTNGNFDSASRHNDVELMDSQVLSSLLFALNPASIPNSGSHGTSLPTSYEHSSALRHPDVAMQGKGFAPPPVTTTTAPPKPKQKSEKLAQVQSKQVQKQPTLSDAEIKAAKDLDNLKSQGYPEYEICIREVPEEGTPGEWLAVGAMAVPRSGSVDKALAGAIFENEDDLLAGAYRNHPFLKKSKEKLEYGFRLQEFPDEEVKAVNKKMLESEGNFFTKWFDNVDNPFNDGSGWFNPNKKE